MIAQIKNILAGCGVATIAVIAGLQAQSPRGPEAVGLSLFFNNGTMNPLTFYGNPPRYVNEIDIVTSTQPQSTDDGIDSLKKLPKLSKFDWTGVKMVDEDWRQSMDGTYQRQRFYRNANWMNAASQFVIYAVDERGRRLAPRLVARAGRDDRMSNDDDFFVRRFAVRQIATGCKKVGDCAGARFVAQQLVHVRYARSSQNQSVVFPPETQGLQLEWNQAPSSTYSVPVKHAAPGSVPYGYGFRVELAVVSSPANGRFYTPGESVKLQFTFLDGKGNRLHPLGSLPTYAQFIRGETVNGLEYYDSPRLNSTVYYALKHREANILVGLSGPTNKLRQSKSILDGAQLLEKQAVTQTVMTDGYSGLFTGVPPFSVSLGGRARWDDPVPDTVTLTIPKDALPGTYVAAIKARRNFGGEALNRAASTTLQVGTSAPTTFMPATGKCETCHQGPSGFDRILHGVTDRRACFACHVALSFENDNALEVRVHAIHSRSRRFAADSKNCSVCHFSTPDGPAKGWLAGAGF
jgi:hypothetical protein